VEDTTILLIIGMIGLFALVGAKMFNPNQAKSKVKSRKDNAIETLDKVTSETIDRLAKELKKESGRANRLQALKDQDEELEEEPGKQVTFEEIQALVKQTYPKYSPMLPLIKKQIMDITKGMTLEEILDYVKQITGNKQSPTGDPNSISQGFEQRPDYA